MKKHVGKILLAMVFALLLVPTVTAEAKTRTTESGNKELIYSDKTTLLNLYDTETTQTSITITKEMITSYTEDQGDGAFYTIIQYCLNYAKEKSSASNPITITVEAGEYSLTNQLHIYSNTTLNVTGATITNATNKKHHMLIVGTPSSDQPTGYDYYKNITIIGGTWNGNGAACAAAGLGDTPLFQIAHVTNLTIQNVTLLDPNDNHHMELAACNNVTITGCVFRNQTVKSSTHATEALQLDINNKNFGEYGTYLVSGDKGYGCKNVEISGCTFENVVRGVGSHSSTASYPYENISIHDNKFTNISGQAIRLQCYKNSNVYNNVISGTSGSGIYVYSTNTGTSIYSNTISSGSSYGIYVAGSATVASLKSNTIKSMTSGGIYVGSSAKVTDITSNTISSCPYGVYVYAGTVTNIKSNKLTSCTNGIYASSATVTSVKKNTIKKSKYGIYVVGGNVTGILSNTINKSTGSGVVVVGSATVGKISKNTIKTSSSNGITMKSSTVTNINSNTIAAAKYGIYMSESTASQILKNTIRKCTKAGVKICKKSTVNKFGSTTYKKNAKKYIVSSNSKIKKTV